MINVHRHKMVDSIFTTGCSIVQVEDVVCGSGPDPLALATYLAQLHRVLAPARRGAVLSLGLLVRAGSPAARENSFREEALSKAGVRIESFTLKQRPQLVQTSKQIRG